MAGGEPGVDISTADSALDYRFSHSDGRFGYWTAAELDEFLLCWYPRKVTMGREDWAGVVPRMRAWIGFRDGAGLLNQLSDSAPVLRRALRRIEREFPTAMADESRWGMAKGLAMSMLEADVDITHRAADRWRSHSTRLDSSTPSTLSPQAAATESRSSPTKQEGGAQVLGRRLPAVYAHGTVRTGWLGRSGNVG